MRVFDCLKKMKPCQNFTPTTWHFKGEIFTKNPKNHHGIWQIPVKYFKNYETKSKNAMKNAQKLGEKPPNYRIGQHTTNCKQTYTNVQTIK